MNRSSMNSLLATQASIAIQETVAMLAPKPTRRERFFRWAAGDSNIYHWIAVAIVWSAAIFFGLALAKHGVSGVTVTEVLEVLGKSANIAGAVFIAAGVIYSMPEKSDVQTLLAFEAHVESTFYVASRACKIGIWIVLTGAAADLFAGVEFIKELH